MSLPKLLIDENELEYIVEKGQKKAVILKIDEFEKLKQLIEIEKGEKKGGAKALWNLIVQIEQNHLHNSKSPKKNISSHYKEHLYGKNGILK